MTEKLPQSTDVLIKRLRRVAKWLRDEEAYRPFMSEQWRAGVRARANTCDQAAGRLEDFMGGKTPEAIEHAVTEAHR